MTLGSARTANEFLRAVERFDAAAVEEFNAALAAALEGDGEAAAMYARTVRRFVDELVETSGLIDDSDDRDLARQVLLVRSSNAWATSWVATAGLGEGTAAAIAALARSLNARLPAIEVPPGMPKLLAAMEMTLFERRVSAELRGDRDPLDVIRDELQLNGDELGALFGVSRQAVDQWRRDGIPPARLGAVAAVLGTVELLARKLRDGRVKMVVRRPATAFAGATMLEALRDDPEGTFAKVAETFDVSTTA